MSDAVQNTQTQAKQCQILYRTHKHKQSTVSDIAEHTNIGKAQCQILQRTHKHRQSTVSGIAKNTQTQAKHSVRSCKEHTNTGKAQCQVLQRTHRHKQSTVSDLVENNNNRIQRRYSRFFTIFLTAPRTVSNTYAQVARAQSCANHVQHIKRLSCASATRYEGTAQLFSLTELKSHLFELYFIG